MPKRRKSLQKIFLASLLLLPLRLHAEAPGTEDVIILKDGSILRGSIIEEKPASEVTIENDRQDALSFPMSDVEKIKKEPALDRDDEASRESRRDWRLERKAIVLSQLDPHAALIRSLCAPSWGQYYNHQLIKGAIMDAVMIGGLAYIAAGSGLGDIGSVDGNYASSDPKVQDVYLAGGIALIAGTWIWSVVDAPSSARKISRENSAAYLWESEDQRLAMGLNFINIQKNCGASCTFYF